MPTKFGADARPLGENVTEVAGPTGTVGFSPALNHARIGAGWASWSHGYTGDIYHSNGATSVTLTMPPATTGFYLYAEPVDFAVFTITAQTQDGTTSPAVLVDGQGGATYFGFYGVNGMTIETVTVTSPNNAFAVGEFGICTPPPPVIPTITALSDARVWLQSIGGWADSALDVRAELLKNGATVATGLTRCVSLSFRDQTEVLVPWSAFDAVPLAPGDVVEIRFAARVGTQADDSKCTGPGASALDDSGVAAQGGSFHSRPAPVRARLFYDSDAKASRFGITIDPDPAGELFLHSNGTPCGWLDSLWVSQRTLDPEAPGHDFAKCKDSSIVHYWDGNPWQVVGTWSRAPQ